MCSLKSESYVGSVTSVSYVTSENFVQSVTSESLCIVCDVGNLYAFQATTASLKYFSDKFKYLALYGSADRQPKMALRLRNTSAKGRATFYHNKVLCPPRCTTRSCFWCTLFTTGPNATLVKCPEKQDNCKCFPI